MSAELFAVDLFHGSLSVGGDAMNAAEENAQFVLALAERLTERLSERFYFLAVDPDDFVERLDSIDRRLDDLCWELSELRKAVAQ